MWWCWCWCWCWAWWCSWKLCWAGVRGDGVPKTRESLESLRTSGGVCGERLGVEVQLEARECARGWWCGWW